MEEDDEDDYDDYIREEDYYDDEPEDLKDKKENPDTIPGLPEGKKLRVKPIRKKIQLNFDELETKGHKILRKLARFLLERYMHPREFYGPVINR